MTSRAKNIFSIALILVSFFVFAHTVSAAPGSTNLILCNTNQDLTGSPITTAPNYNPKYGQFLNPCDFGYLVQLGINVVYSLIVFSVPVAVLSFIYAGFLYLTSQGNPGQISKAHGIFKTTAIGFVIVLSAWLIVYAITGSLLNPTYNPLIPPTG